MERDDEGGLRAKQDYSSVESANWYSYVSNSPLTCIDTTGCDDITLGVAFDVAAGGNAIRVSGVAVGVGIVLDTDVLSDSGFYLTSGESRGGGASLSGTLGYYPSEVVVLRFLSACQFRLEYRLR